MVERARILVIDDDDSIRTVFKTILEEMGYFVDTAMTGKEAIEKMEAEYFNLALIDIKLPDMEGTALLDAAEESVPRMVKIIITGWPTLENAVEAVNRGADAYILKPVKIEELQKTIEKHLEKQREAQKYSEEKVYEFIKTRARKLDYLSKSHLLARR